MACTTLSLSLMKAMRRPKTHGPMVSMSRRVSRGPRRGRRYYRVEAVRGGRKGGRVSSMPEDSE